MTEVAHSRDELKDIRDDWEEAHRKVAVVMTMGALHGGHAELIRRARERSDRVIVTDFLNPLQFAPGEDLDRYPRTFSADLALCQQHGVDALFAPEADEVYRHDPEVTVRAGRVGDVLEGHSRPGHFDGVLTVVAKLLHLTRPHSAFFGQKDAQQVWLINRMVQDLEFPVQVVEVPTVRDSDGLALSSRNTYLTSEDRHSALALYSALRAGSSVADKGTTAVIATSERTLAGANVKADYVALVSPETFTPLTRAGGSGLLLVAAYVGSTRLIDNVRLVVGSEEKDPSAAHD